MASSIPHPIAVVDVETTGLFPSRHHRVVEIAVVVVGQDGRIIREFVTLINPQRDMGPSRIHGLSAEDVLHAPSFDEVAGHIAEALQGTAAIAGHNVRFDESFLRSEFGRLDLALPEYFSVCTMQLAGGGKLADCCCDYGVVLDGTAHHALADARAAALLLALLLPDQPRVLDDLSRRGPVAWPTAMKSTRAPVSRDQARRQQSEIPQFLQRLLRRKNASAEATPEDDAEMAYCALLDRILEDRHVDEAEADALLETAATWGLDGPRIQHVHDSYLAQLARAALADGIVTDTEGRDLQTVARLLGRDQKTLDRLLADAACNEPATSPPIVAKSEDSLAGKRVCFTGELMCRYRGEPITRDQAEELAAAAALVICDSVTKRLDLLVVADAHTQSGKAKKARSYGVRIMHEPVFWKSIGVAVS